MSSPVIHRYEVPIDDEWHTLELTGQVLHVAGKKTAVEFWATTNTEAPRLRDFCVFATGVSLPDGLVATTWKAPWGLYLGTAVVPYGPGARGVWHLFERVWEDPK